MKHLYRNISLFILIILLAGCGKNNSPENQVTKKVITEQEIKDSDFDEGDSSSSNQFPEETVVPRINIENRNLIEYIRNVNLDFDTEEEQLIVQKDRDVKNRLKIIVIDFDSVRNKYITTWETVKENINPRTFIISYADIVGDHNLEILFRGNRKQRRTDP